MFRVGTGYIERAGRNFIPPAADLRCPVSGGNIMNFKAPPAMAVAGDGAPQLLINQVQYLEDSASQGKACLLYTSDAADE